MHWFGPPAPVCAIENLRALERTQGESFHTDVTLACRHSDFFPMPTWIICFLKPTGPCFMTPPKTIRSKTQHRLDYFWCWLSQAQKWTTSLKIHSVHLADGVTAKLLLIAGIEPNPGPIGNPNNQLVPQPAETPFLIANLEGITPTVAQEPSDQYKHLRDEFAALYAQIVQTMLADPTAPARAWVTMDKNTNWQYIVDALDTPRKRVRAWILLQALNYIDTHPALEAAMATYIVERRVDWTSKPPFLDYVDGSQGLQQAFNLPNQNRDQALRRFHHDQSSMIAQAVQTLNRIPSQIQELTQQVNVTGHHLYSIYISTMQSINESTNFLQDKIGGFLTTMSVTSNLQHEQVTRHFNELYNLLMRNIAATLTEEFAKHLAEFTKVSEIVHGNVIRTLGEKEGTITNMLMTTGSTLTKVYDGQCRVVDSTKLIPETMDRNSTKLDQIADTLEATKEVLKKTQEEAREAKEALRRSQEEAKEELKRSQEELKEELRRLARLISSAESSPDQPNNSAPVTTQSDQLKPCETPDALGQPPSTDGFMNADAAILNCTLAKALSFSDPSFPHHTQNSKTMDILYHQHWPSPDPDPDPITSRLELILNTLERTYSLPQLARWTYGTKDGPMKICNHIVLQSKIRFAELPTVLSQGRCKPATWGDEKWMVCVVVQNAHHLEMTGDTNMDLENRRYHLRANFRLHENRVSTVYPAQQGAAKEYQLTKGFDWQRKTKRLAIPTPHTATLFFIADEPPSTLTPTIPAGKSPKPPDPPPPPTSPKRGKPPRRRQTAQQRKGSAKEQPNKTTSQEKTNGKKHNTDIRVATLNVRHNGWPTLSRNIGQVMRHHNADILVVTEVHPPRTIAPPSILPCANAHLHVPPMSWTSRTKQETSLPKRTYRTLWATSATQSNAWIGFIVRADEDARKRFRVRGVEIHPEGRVARLDVKLGRRECSIIGVYAPASATPQSYEFFLLEVASMLPAASSHTILTGDWNARLRSRADRDGPNRKGEVLADFLEGLKMVDPAMHLTKKQRDLFTRFWTPNQGGRNPSRVRTAPDMVFCTTAFHKSGFTRDVMARFVPLMRTLDHRMLTTRLSIPTERARRIPPNKRPKDSASDPHVQAAIDTFQDACANVTPDNQHRIHSPWKTPGCINASNARDRAYAQLKQAKAKGCGRDKLNLLEARMKEARQRENEVHREAFRASLDASLERANKAGRDGREEDLFRETRWLTKPVLRTLPASKNVLNEYLGAYRERTTASTLRCDNAFDDDSPLPLRCLSGEASHRKHRVESTAFTDGSALLGAAGYGVVFATPDGIISPSGNRDDCFHLRPPWPPPRPPAEPPPSPPETEDECSFHTMSEYSSSSEPSSPTPPLLPSPDLPPNVFGKTWGKQSNNRAELCALVRACELGMANCTSPDTTCLSLHVYTDSMFVINGHKTLDRARESNFWDTEHGDLWRTVARYIHAGALELTLTHVPAHTADTGIPHLLPDPRTTPFPTLGNFYADELATRAVMEIIRDGDGLTPERIEDPSPIPWTGASDLPPTKEELERALADLHDTSPGPDRIRIGDLRNATNAAAKEAWFNLIQTVWERSCVPRSFRVATVIAIPKPGPNTPANQRYISLLNKPGTLLTRVLYNRARAVPLDTAQYGFRRARSTTDAIFVVSQLQELAMRYRRPCIIVFVDIAKAYDTLNRTVLWETLEDAGLGPTAVNLIKQMYMDKYRLRVGGRITSRSHPTTQGVRQGCLLSPLFFNMVMDRIIRDCKPHMRGYALEDQRGRSVYELSLLAYADDIAIISPDKRTAEANLHHLQRSLAKANLFINPGKTKWMRFAPRAHTTAEDEDPISNATRAAMKGWDPRGKFATWDTELPPEYRRLGGRYLWLTYDRAATTAEPMPCPFCQKPQRRVEKHLEAVHGLVVNVGSQPEPYFGDQPGNIEKEFRCGVRGCKRQKLNGLDRYRRHLQEDHTSEEREPLLKRCWRHPHLKHPLRTWDDWRNNSSQRQTSVRSRRNEEMGTLHELLRDDGDDVQIVPLGTTKPVEHATKYKYLGRIFQENGNCTPHIQERRSNATWKMSRLKEVFRSDKLDTRLKVKLWTSIGLSSMMYALETIAITAYHASTLHSLQLRTLRNAIGIPIRVIPAAEGGRPCELKYPRTREVLTTARQYPILALIEQANLRFYGHLLRRPDDFAPHRVLHSVPVNGVRFAIGGTFKTWPLYMEKLLRRLKLQSKDTQDRKMWREKVNNAIAREVAKEGFDAPYWLHVRRKPRRTTSNTV